MLVIEHTDEGAMGLVLNRPTETTVTDAVPALADLADREDVVHAGGPVGTDSVLALGDFESPEDAGTPVAGSLGLLDPDTPRRGAAPAAGATPATRAGRPASSTRSWPRTRGSSSRLTPTTPSAEGDLWTEALQRKGGRLRAAGHDAGPTRP